MRIVFNEMEDTILHEFNGGNGDVIAKMYFENKNRIMKARLEKGCSIGEHTHTTNTEIIYVVSGTAKITINGEVEYVEEGMAHFCPIGSTHKIEQYGEEALIMVCAVPNICG